MTAYTQTLVTDIINLIEKIFPLTADRFNGKAADIVKRSSLQMGLLDELGLEYDHRKGIIKADTSNLSLKEQSISVEEAFTRECIEEDFIPLLRQEVLKIVQRYDDDPFMDFKFRAEIKLFPSGSNRVEDFLILDYISQNKKKRLLDNIDSYINIKLINGQYPTKELDTHFLSRHLLDNKLYQELNADHIIMVFDRIFDLNRNNQDLLNRHRGSVVYALKKWAEHDFLINYCDIKQDTSRQIVFTLEKRFSIKGLKSGAQVTEEDKPLIDLLIYTAILILKYEPNYARSRGLDYLSYASGLGFAKAKDIQKTGSGQFSKQEVIYKDEDVECLANDIFATFTIKMKQESAAGYQKAIDFMCNLLKKGFPRSYQLKFSSKVKNLLPVKGVGKTKTQHFFANALQYPDLWDSLEAYARTAIHEFEWYEDAEDEYYAMPGTYAVFGLSLNDKKYFPLLEHYLSELDAEHQSVHLHLIKPFISKWGIDSIMMPLLLKWFKTVEDMNPLKLESLFETKENLDLLVKEVKHMDRYDLSHVVYFIWGKSSDLEKRIKKADKELVPILTDILQKIK